LTKKEMVHFIAAELNLDQVMTRKVVQRSLDLILETLAKRGRIELRNFGVFQVKRRAARKARNPRTNQEVIVPSKNVICFQPGKNVASLVNRPHPPAGH
jgi:nucleoid DNA-binding protein